jgi:subtilase family serine protease
MLPFQSFSRRVLASSLLCATAAMCQQYAPSVRIVNPIDESQLTSLKGNTHPAANSANDRGAVSPSLSMGDLILVLSRSQEQQAAFDRFVASQYDPTSPNFHQWLTPEQVGQNFGPSETDIAAISNWLTGHGFTVNEASKDRMTIRFGGTAGQVQSAFHTEIHNLVVKGVPHIANMSDPQIPAALAPAIVGIKQLHDFFPKAQHTVGHKVTLNSETGKWQRTASTPVAAATPGGKGEPLTVRPQFGINLGSGSSAELLEDVVPYDFATMYNVLPLWNAGINGSGQTIAIAGTSLINLSDVATFRSTFGLPAYTTSNQPNQISVNGNFAVQCTSTSPTANCGIGDLTENTLDVEWSGAVAPAAQIVLAVTGYNSNSPNLDTVYSSANYVISNNTAKILSVSYGGCERSQGTAGNVSYYDLWQTAASQGISVFVSSGDSGSALCDDGLDGEYGTPWAAEYGLSVNGLGSTPYNTSVGGTDLNWGTTASPYWGSTNSSTTGASALNYVPEVPWNDTCSNPLALSYLENVASSVKYSGVKDAETACNFIANDSLSIFQQYVYQGTNTPVDITEFVDPVGGSGGASGCIVNTTSSSFFGACTAGSTSAPNGAGSIALVNNGWPKPTWQAGVSGIPNDGVRDLPDVSFFAGNGFLGSATVICISAGGASCVVPPLTSETVEPTGEELGGTSVGTPQMAGVMALVNQKAGSPQGLATPQLYALAAKQSYSGCSAESATNGNGCYFNDIDTGTIAMPCDYGAANGGLFYNSAGQPYVGTQQPGVVSPNCTPIDSGDTVAIQSGFAATSGYDQSSGLGSLNVANVVNHWATNTGLLTPVIILASSSTVPVNLSLNVTATVSGSGATPTGSVTLSGGGLKSPLTGTLSSGADTITVPANSLTVGTDTLNVAYSGDSNYAASATNTIQVTVTAVAELSPVITVTPAQNSITTGSSLVVTGSVTGSGGTATGSVVLSGGGYTSPSTALSAGTYSITIPAGGLIAGSDTLTVTYTPASGSLYAEATSPPATVTVTESSFILQVTTQPIAIPSPGGNATATITVGAGNGYSGQVTFSCQLTGGPSNASADTPVCLSSSTTPVPVGGTETFTIETESVVAAELAYPKPAGKGSGWAGAGGGALLAFLVFLGIPARRRSWRSMLGILVVLVALGSVSGCGGGGGGSSSQGDPGTALGTYTFQITGVGNPAVTPTPSTTFSVTVN